MSKKRSSEILADENGTFFRDKVKFLKFSRKSKNRGNLEQGGKCIMASGGWTPLFEIEIAYILNRLRNLLCESSLQSFVLVDL